MPPLVIVSGPPASGKTTLANLLHHELGLPVISKDLIKEAMAVHLGAGPEVGRAAFAAQFAIARVLLDSGVGLVLEGAFFVEQTEIADIAATTQAVSVNLSCAIEELERRYVDRHLNGRRHPAHRGLEALADLRSRVETGAYGVPEMHRPRLEVVTTHGFDPSTTEIVRWVGAQLV